MEYMNIFKDKEYCKSQLFEAEKVFSNKNTTPKQYEQMKKTLSLMCLHCSDELCGVVLAILEEASYREQYFLKFWKEQSQTFGK